jgi:hypothetical protein
MNGTRSSSRVATPVRYTAQMSTLAELLNGAT